MLVGGAGVAAPAPRRGGQAGAGARLAALDLGPGSPLGPRLLLPGLGRPAYTLREEDFGVPLAEVNYYAWVAGRKPAERLFICGGR